MAGYNTKSFVLQVPEREVTRDGKSVSGMKAGNAVVGVWSTTERKRGSVVAARASRKHKHGNRAGCRSAGSAIPSSTR